MTDNSNTKKNPEHLEYVLRVNGDITLDKALESGLRAIDELDIAELKKIGFRTYKQGKWTIHEILQHLIDWERIWGFRALILARQDGTIPAGHDHDIMAKNSGANRRSIEELVKEFRCVRQSSIYMFESFDKDLLETNCRFFEYEMPLYAIGLTITAHQIHHFNIIKEKYRVLVS